MIATVSKDNADMMNLPADDEANMIYDGKNEPCSILVVDGDGHIRNEFSTIADKMGWEIVVASNGEEALDIILKRSFDFVFTLLKMPGMGGLNLSLQVKAVSLNTLVVQILDEHLANIMNRIKAGRIDCVMPMPLKCGEIQKTVQYFLRHRRT